MSYSMLIQEGRAFLFIQITRAHQQALIRFVPLTLLLLTLPRTHPESPLQRDHKERYFVPKKFKFLMKVNKGL